MSLSAGQASDGTLYIWGDEDELLGLAEALDQVASGGKSHAEDLMVEDAWSHPLHNIQIYVAEYGVLRFAIEGDSAQIFGSQTGLEELALRVRVFCEYNSIEEPGMHMHVDRTDDDELLDRASLELMICGPNP